VGRKGDSFGKNLPVSKSDVRQGEKNLGCCNGRPLEKETRCLTWGGTPKGRRRRGRPGECFVALCSRQGFEKK